MDRSKRTRSRWLEPNAISPIMGLKLDPAATPPAIDLLPPTARERICKGIYFRQNDKLTVCLPRPNPEEDPGREN